RTGRLVAHYRVQGVLGAGAMGVVYTAYDPRLDRTVALKVLREPEGAKAHDRLLSEAQAMAKLAHPNVVTVYDVGTIDGRVFLAMELVEGSSGLAWRTERPRTWREVLDVFLQAGEGLAAAHDA